MPFPFEPKTLSPSLRDLREAMVLPLLTLQKRCMEPIEYAGRIKGRKYYIRVLPAYGMSIPTIWDWDILIACISWLNAASEQGAEISNIISFKPYQLLKLIGRHTSASDYRRLANAIRRLRTATVITNADLGKGFVVEQAFSWITDYELPQKFTDFPSDVFGEVQPDESKPWQITISPWLLDVINSKKDILAVHPLYFKLKSGIDRQIYRIARKSANASKNYWDWKIDTLHKICCLKSPISKLRRKLKDRSQCPPFRSCRFFD